MYFTLHVFPLLVCLSASMYVFARRQSHTRYDIKIVNAIICNSNYNCTNVNQRDGLNLILD